MGLAMRVLGTQCVRGHSVIEPSYVRSFECVRYHVKTLSI